MNSEKLKISAEDLSSKKENRENQKTQREKGQERSEQKRGRENTVNILEVFGKNEEI